MANYVVYNRPYDSEVEYLQSTGTQWIDTEYKMKLEDEIHLKFVSKNEKTAIFGSRGYSTENFYQMYLHVDYLHADKMIAAFGTVGFNYNNEINSFVFGSPNEAILKNGVCIMNGVETQIDVGTQDSVQNLAIFARRNEDNTVNYLSQAILYYFKIYRNNVLIKDFIPVRKGNVGYLFDKVSGRLFANKGTGNFTLGNDVNNPVPNIRRVFRFGNKRFVYMFND